MTLHSHQFQGPHGQDYGRAHMVTAKAVAQMDPNAVRRIEDAMIAAMKPREVSGVRKNNLLAFLKSNGPSSMNQILDVFHQSEKTIDKDLKAMISDKLATRKRGQRSGSGPTPYVYEVAE